MSRASGSGERVVADTSVLINFLRLDRMDLIGAHPGSFVATDHVAAEIAQAPQRERYERALRADHVAEERFGKLHCAGTNSASSARRASSWN
ncbi:hypothetical protein [Candidatus Palauibacter sp.]|uniref:hypothetical protein n=1 Tax=Candidatus Palauibacter sp. TaxID=3101350 RepID=UPI003AF28C6B